MLWLGLHFPQLPLQSISRALTNTLAFAITDKNQAPRLICCNRFARQQGLRPGMALSAAYALKPDLIAKPRDLSKEQAALERLAAWGLQFTSRLSIMAPQSLLLEIGNSENYFGNRQSLLKRIQTGLDELGYEAYHAVAPTPTAALWLAANKVQCTITDPKALARQLGPLPLSSLNLPSALLSQLQKTGFYNVADCLRLPRAQFSRRFGQSFCKDLDRALGKLADPQTCYQPPARFQAGMELPAEIENAQALMAPLQVLLLELSGFLQARQAGTQELHLDLLHERQPATRLVFQTVALGRDVKQWQQLIQTRLETVQLAQAVHEIQLRVDKIQPQPTQATCLFTELSETQTESWQRLLDRLHARMGPYAVRGVKSVADHRPEKSWCYCSPGEQSPTIKITQRPLWLLETPQRLDRHGRKLYWRGELQLYQGPERIESGWWDNQGIQRDYFIARNPNGSLLWVFHNRGNSEQWYLHGIFS